MGVGKVKKNNVLRLRYSINEALLGAKGRESEEKKLHFKDPIRTNYDRTRGCWERKTGGVGISHTRRYERKKMKAIFCI